MAQDNKDPRARLRDYKRTMDERFGVLCFCRGWSNPLLWSHYADKHRGMCLGFDLAENTVSPVNYVTERVPIQYPFTQDLETISNQLLWTKYIDWRYEEEWRSWIKFMERDPITQLYFCNFDEKIQPKEVIAGPLCDVTEREIRGALGDIKDVDVIKARHERRSQEKTHLLRLGFFSLLSPLDRARCVLTYRAMCSVAGPCDPVVWIFSTSGFHRFFATKPVRSETNKAERSSVWRP